MTSSPGLLLDTSSPSVPIMFSSETSQDAQREDALISRAQLLTDLEISVAAAIDELRVMAHDRRLSVESSSRRTPGVGIVNSR